jgi:hypothetical protein
LAFTVQKLCERGIASDASTRAGTVFLAISAFRPHLAREASTSTSRIKFVLDGRIYRKQATHGALALRRKLPQIVNPKVFFNRRDHVRDFDSPTEIQPELQRTKNGWFLASNDKPNSPGSLMLSA